MSIVGDREFATAMEQRDIGNCVAIFDEYHPTWRDRIRWALFPMTYCELPEVPSEAATKDCVTVHSVTKFSWADRLRVLISGRVETVSRTVTQHEVGHTFTKSECFPLGPEFLEK